jgi:tetratricopeptide (TPR) repeat protein
MTAHKEGRFKEAEASYKKAIEFKPDLTVTHNNLGVLLKGLGRLEEATASFKKAIKLKPNYAEAYNNLGITVKEIGKLDEAKICFIKATKFNPKYVSAYHNLGTILQELKKLGEAEVCYSKAIELKPSFGPALLNRGQVLFDKDEHELSLRDFDACNNTDSKSRALASLYALGRIDEIYKRINAHSKLDDENLHIAAFSSFITAKKKKIPQINSVRTH